MDIADLLRDKRSVIEKLLKSVELNNKIIQGLSTMKERGFSNEGMIEKLVQSSIVMCSQLSTLPPICLAYSQGTDFDKDVAGMMNKMGRGDEAIRIMMENKFKQ